MLKIIPFLKFIFHTSILFLIILSLFPGSIPGLILYGDLAKEPNIIDNPFGTSLNHFFYYFYVSILGLFIYLKDKRYKILFYRLFFLSGILEILQLMIPSRTFQYYDLIANFSGVLVAYFLVKIYLHFKRHE